MIKGPMAGLEKLEDEIAVTVEGDVVETEDGAVAPEVVVQVMDAIITVEVAEKEMDEAEVVEADAENDVATLEHIVTMIKTHGISRPMMEMADPNGHLVTKGLVAAYETLEMTPVHDRNATAAIETIVETIKSALRKVWEFFKMVAKKVAAYFSAVVDMFLSYETVINGLIKRFEKIKSLDAEKMKDKKVSISKAATAAKAAGIIGGLTSLIQKGIDIAALKSGDFKTDAPEYAKSMKDVSSGFVNADVMAIFGYDIKMTEDGKLSVSRKAVANTLVGLNKVGATKEAIVSRLKDALGAVKKIAEKKAMFDKLQGAFAHYANTTEKAINAMKDTDPKAAEEAKASLQTAKSFISGVKELSMVAIKCANMVAKDAITIAKAGIEVAA